MCVGYAGSQLFDMMKYTAATTPLCKLNYLKYIFLIFFFNITHTIIIIALKKRRSYYLFQRNCNAASIQRWRLFEGVV